MSKLSISEIITTIIYKLIESKTYLNESRTDDRHFVRSRKLPFSHMIRFILSNSKLSLRSGLERFFKDIGDSEMCCSAQAFSKRRQFIKPSAILKLTQCVAKSFYDEADYKTWNNHLLLAIDGTRCNLPCNKETAEFFHEQKTIGNPQVQALCSCLYDVMNNLVVDASINPCTANERELAAAHLELIHTLKQPENGTIILFDRGYPSAKLLDALEANGLKYVMRFSTTFLSGCSLDKEDYIITRKLKNSRNPHTMRILNFDVEGTKEHLVTNIFDPTLTTTEFKELYHLRWGIETAYRTMKSYMDMENFSGVLPVAICQDFFATTFLYNMLSVAEFDLADEFEKLHNNDPEKKLQYKLNCKHMIDVLKPEVVQMLLSPKWFRRAKCAKLCTSMIKAASAVRPNRRSSVRQKKHGRSKFSSTYKPSMP